jgi:hypothetical protein
VIYRRRATARGSWCLDRFSCLLTIRATAAAVWVGGLSFELKSTPVISGDTLYINGFGSPENQPGAKIAIAPTAEVFATHDVNKDGQLSSDELPTAHIKESLEFFDLNGDKTMDRAEWDYYKAAMESENGMLAIAGRIWRYDRDRSAVALSARFTAAITASLQTGALHGERCRWTGDDAPPRNRR